MKGMFSEIKSNAECVRKSCCFFYKMYDQVKSLMGLKEVYEIIRKLQSR